jgi:beta-glucanase (GH16 family)
MEWTSQLPAAVRGAADYTVNGGLQTSGGATQRSSALSGDYHVFAIEWTDQTMDWFIDTIDYASWHYTTASPPPDGNPFQNPFYLILDYAVGGDSTVPPDSSQYPSEMRVDWVRVWQ